MPLAPPSDRSVLREREPLDHQPKIRQWRGSEPRQEAAGRVEVAVVGGAVDSAQVRLFDSADLELEGNDQGGESDDADDVGDDEGEAGGGDGHGSEDGVADSGEDAGCDELGAFVGVDPDPPRGAHLKLSDRRGRDAGECDHDPGGAQSRVIKERHGVEASKSGDGGGDAGCDGGDEGELGPPSDAAGVGVEAQAGVAGAAPLDPGAPAEPDDSEDCIQDEGEGVHGWFSLAGAGVVAWNRATSPARPAVTSMSAKPAAASPSRSWAGWRSW